MERHGQVVRITPGMRERYLELHAAVWPEVEATLSTHHVTNYTIFIHGELLFAYYEYVGADHDADMARIAADPVTQEWWTHTDPCQTPVEAPPGTPPGTPWSEMTEAWHLA
ncbi:L-rhamnose mutarotase [Oerskovia flava]|uniref:L-rhamnose mutarotase n=1 Tax=Oerskovia flava TaxID=2986422 RepID=UPI00224033F1|nr:L-rhamnose mutarotase [Oerskovia sp. JB1-3-2]